MDNRTEVRDFLTSRRGRLSPEQAGLTSRGARRVPGLRRAEGAQLAGISIEYYVRLGRGNLAGASEAVLGARGARPPSTPASIRPGRRPRPGTAQGGRDRVGCLMFPPSASASAHDVRSEPPGTHATSLG